MPRSSQNVQRSFDKNFEVEFDEVIGRLVKTADSTLITADTTRTTADAGETRI